MKIDFEILRTDSTDFRQYIQKISFETMDVNATVATALDAINGDAGMRDADGNPISHIHWECSCLQKKCGACAMLINGKPGLACDARLSDFGKGKIRLEPLRKFPVVADLIVDRSVLRENLKGMRAWLSDKAEAEKADQDVAYEGSRCLQCGCCLEVCPNFYAGGSFAGMAVAVPTARLLAELPREQREAIGKAYRQHVYEGCGKSLACRNICPAGIKVDDLLVNSNAIAVWKRHPGQKKG